MARVFSGNGHDTPSPSEHALSEAFLRLGDVLVADFDVADFLTTLTARYVELSGVDAAGVTITGADGTSTLIGASCEDAHLLERLQQRVSSGPLADGTIASACGQHPDVAERAPWPKFADTMLVLGYRAVLAVPMRLRETRLGAATLYRAEPGPFAKTTVELARALADIATMSVLLQRASAKHQRAVARLDESLPRQPRRH